jgi:hypothetical protein
MNDAAARKSSATAATWLAAALVLFAASGANCQRPLVMSPFGPGDPSAPQVLMAGATRDQIIAAVNQNSAHIRSISATGASITIPDTMNLPILTANIAAERPNHFRLTAGTAITGQEIDLGSNDERFWMWVRRNQPPAVYSCRHDQFANSAIRQMMPIEPSWLLAALGMVDIDPASVYDGPLARGDGKVEIRSWLPSASGRLTRVTVIDASRAWVVEQHVYDPTGQTLIASAVAESHHYYPAEGVSLPQRISLRLPTAGLAMKIDLGSVQINQLAGDPNQLWTMPVFAGYPQIDLGGAVMTTPVPGRPFSQPLSPLGPPAATPYPTTGAATSPPSASPFASSAYSQPNPPASQQSAYAIANPVTAPTSAPSAYVSSTAATVPSAPPSYQAMPAYYTAPPTASSAPAPSAAPAIYQRPRY